MASSATEARMNFNPEWMRSAGCNKAVTTSASAVLTTIASEIKGPIAPPKLSNHRYSREELLALRPDDETEAPLEEELIEHCSCYYEANPLPPVCMTQFSDTEEKLLVLGVNSSKIMNVMNQHEKERTGGRWNPGFVGRGVGRGAGGNSPINSMSSDYRDRPFMPRNDNQPGFRGPSRGRPYGSGRGVGPGREGHAFVATAAEDGAPSGQVSAGRGREIAALAERSMPGERRSSGRSNSESENWRTDVPNPRAQGLIDQDEQGAARPRVYRPWTGAGRGEGHGEHDGYRAAVRMKSNSQCDVPEWVTEEVDEHEGGSFDAGQFMRTAINDGEAFEDQSSKKTEPTVVTPKSASSVSTSEAKSRKLDLDVNSAATKSSSDAVQSHAAKERTKANTAPLRQSTNAGQPSVDATRAPQPATRGQVAPISAQNDGQELAQTTSEGRGAGRGRGRHVVASSQPLPVPGALPAVSQSQFAVGGALATGSQSQAPSNGPSVTADPLAGNAALAALFGKSVRTQPPQPTPEAQVVVTDVQSGRMRSGTPPEESFALVESMVKNLTEVNAHATSRVAVLDTYRSKVDLQEERLTPPDVKGQVNSAQSDTWFYKDSSGSVQGPFPKERMTHWFVQGYFQMNLLIKRQSDADFVTLGEYIQRFGRVPFVPASPEKESLPAFPETTASSLAATHGMPKPAPAMPRFLPRVSGPDILAATSSHITAQFADGATPRPLRGLTPSSSQPTLKGFWDDSGASSAATIPFANNPNAPVSGNLSASMPVAQLQYLQDERRRQELQMRQASTMDDELGRQRMLAQLRETELARQREEVERQRRQAEQEREEEAKRQREQQQRRLEDLARKQEEERQQKRREEEERARQLQLEAERKQQREAEERRRQEEEQRQREEQRLQRERLRAEKEREEAVREQKRIAETRMRQQEQQKKAQQSVRSKDMSEDKQQQPWSTMSAAPAQVAVCPRVQSLLEIQAEEERQARAEQRQQREMLADQKNAHPLLGSGTASATRSSGAWAKPAAWSKGATSQMDDQGDSFWSEMQQSKPPLASPNAPPKQESKRETNRTTLATAHNKENNAQKMKKALFQPKSAGDAFETWCMEQVVSFCSDIDPGTFVAFLMATESAVEVEEYCESYLGTGRKAKDFVKAFVGKRALLKDSGAQADDLFQPAPALNPRLESATSESSAASAGGSNKTKKKKAKMNKVVDSKILGFKTAADPDRLNVGELDMDV